MCISKCSFVASGKVSHNMLRAFGAPDSVLPVDIGSELLHERLNGVAKVVCFGVACCVKVFSLRILSTQMKETVENNLQ